MKTESSKRYIVVDDYLLSELRRWRERQAENEQELGASYIQIYCESDGSVKRQSKGLPLRSGEKVSLVCTLRKGSLLPKTYFVNQLRLIGLNAHSFRHAHATQLIENGAPAKAVAGRLGHANALITQNLYTHNTQKLQ